MKTTKYQTFAVTKEGKETSENNFRCNAYSAHYADDYIAIIAASIGDNGYHYFRSDRGAKIACEQSIKVIRAYFGVRKMPEVIDQTFDISVDELIEAICREWQLEVEKDWNNDTPTDLLLEEPGEIMWPPALYGVHLIVAVVTQIGWFSFKIGAGQVLSIEKDDNALQPFKANNGDHSDEETLSDIEAAALFQKYESPKIPKALFISINDIFHFDGKEDSCLAGIVINNTEQETKDDK